MFFEILLSLTLVLDLTYYPEHEFTREYMEMYNMLGIGVRVIFNRKNRLDAVAFFVIGVLTINGSANQNQNS